MSRKVRIASICMAPDYEEEPEAILREVEKAAAAGADLILTPEIWSGQIAEPEDDGFRAPVLERAAAIAVKYHTYVVVCMERYLSETEEEQIRKADEQGIWQKAQRLKHNSSFLLDRQGRQVYIYDKIYPYPPEFKDAKGDVCSMAELMEASVLEEPNVPGTKVGVYDCDFGRVGFAICFDMNFPELWRQMAAQDVELVAWSSAFSGGRNAAFRAGTNHYYVVSCTSVGRGDCRVADINGDQLLVQYPREGEVANVAKVTLDLDRTIFHKNFNEAVIERIEREYPGRVQVDRSLYAEEEWIILSTEDEDITVGELCEVYGLLPLRRFKTTGMAAYVDELRGMIPWN
ncbi:carbon-nitrogen hydrolase family protein [Hominifimenecus sp. rT4P-3]|uniref:carbon-nitrogen hydrolase family protein n=1 Tax=Hominifimenecus sp. rT4P-3 TaxID=3242979 RepID=UPI003DA45CC6